MNEVVEKRKTISFQNTETSLRFQLGFPSWILIHCGTNTKGRANARSEPGCESKGFSARRDGDRINCR